MLHFLSNHRPVIGGSNPETCVKLRLGMWSTAKMNIKHVRNYHSESTAAMKPYIHIHELYMKTSKSAGCICWVPEKRGNHTCCVLVGKSNTTCESDTLELHLHEAITCKIHWIASARVSNHVPPKISDIKRSFPGCSLRFRSQEILSRHSMKNLGF